MQELLPLFPSFPISGCSTGDEDGCSSDPADVTSKGAVCKTTERLVASRCCLAASASPRDGSWQPDVARADGDVLTGTTCPLSHLLPNIFGTHKSNGNSCSLGMGAAISQVLRHRQ